MAKANLKVVKGKKTKLEIEVSDSEVLDSISNLKKEEQQKFIQEVFDIGVRVWRISKVDIDYQKLDVQREKLVSSFESLAKDAETNLTDMADDLLKGRNGKLAKAVSRETNTMIKEVKGLFESDSKKSVPSQIEKTVGKTVEAVVGSVMEEIKSITDASDVNSPLSKIKDQILKGVIDPIENLMEDFTEVANTIKTHALVRDEYEKGTKKGLKYEEVIGDMIESFTIISGDLIDRVGNEDGVAKTGEGKKKGDHVVVMEDSDGISSRVVFEVKNISKKPSVASVIKLLDASCQNRQSSIGIYVASSKKAAPVQSSFARLSPGRYSVVVDKDFPDPTALEVCYQVARIESLNKAKAELNISKEIDFEEVSQSLKNLMSLTEILINIKNNISKAEADMGDATENVQRLESSLKSGIAGLKSALEVTGEVE